MQIFPKVYKKGHQTTGFSESHFSFVLLYPLHQLNVKEILHGHFPPLLTAKKTENHPESLDFKHSSSSEFL